MSRIEKYANWLTENQDKKGTEDFEKVANAYKALRSQKSELKTSSFKDLLQQKILLQLKYEILLTPYMHHN